jgi:hypothetical protein
MQRRHTAPFAVGFVTSGKKMYSLSVLLDIIDISMKEIHALCQACHSKLKVKQQLA